MPIRQWPNRVLVTATEENPKKNTLSRLRNARRKQTADNCTLMSGVTKNYGSCDRLNGKENK